MHICYLCDEYPPSSGGIGTSIQNLARELVRQGHAVTVLGVGVSRQFNDEGVNVRFLSPVQVPKLGWLFNRLRLAKVIQFSIAQEGLQIVEAHDWTGISAGLKLRCPLVVRCHGSDTYFGRLLGYQPRLKVYWAEKLALESADSISAVSQFTAETTKAIFHLSKPIKVIPNGVDIQKFYPTQRADEGFILYFGTLVRKKGVLDLARIFSRIVEECPQSQLVMIGRDAPDRQTGSSSTWEVFCKTISSRGLENVRYLGPQPYEKVVQYIQKASVCVFPSYAEALPMSWLEAMACGKAVVASNIGWANEIIENGVSGVLIHPTDHVAYAHSVVELLEHPEKRKQMGKLARERVEQFFSVQRVASRSLDWYQEAIGIHA